MPLGGGRHTRSGAGGSPPRGSAASVGRQRITAGRRSNLRPATTCGLIIAVCAQLPQWMWNCSQPLAAVASEWMVSVVRPPPPTAVRKCPSMVPIEYTAWPP